MHFPEPKMPTDPRFIDLRGQRFGRIVVVAFHSKIPNEPTKWFCKCACGNEAIITTKGLREQGTKSCGCLQKEATRKSHIKHGMSKTPIWNIWVSMIQRCFDKNCKLYPYYGGRGITVSNAWKSNFMNFYHDMGERPSRRYTLERKNNDGNYEAGNVIWATREDQMNNFRRNVTHEYRGEKLTMRKIIKKSNSSIPYRVAMDRVRRGWSAELAVTIPVRQGNYRRCSRCCPNSAASVPICFSDCPNSLLAHVSSWLQAR